VFLGDDVIEQDWLVGGYWVESLISKSESLKEQLIALTIANRHRPLARPFFSPLGKHAARFGKSYLNTRYLFGVT